jgi:hypothetical protein
VTHREYLLRGDVHSEHIVHFFDDDAARVGVVTAFLSEALGQTQSVVVVARPKIWSKISAGLTARGADVAVNARLIVLDAYQTLAGMMRRGRFDPDLFHRTVAPLVRDAVAASPVGVSAYGEMVDILASEGNFTAAQELERVWNELASEVSFTLLCGYSSAHFASVHHRDAMMAICAAHSKVRTDSSDALGRWLVRETGLAS